MQRSPLVALAVGVGLLLLFGFSFTRADGAGARISGVLQAEGDVTHPFELYRAEVTDAPQQTPTPTVTSTATPTPTATPTLSGADRDELFLPLVQQ